MTEQALDSSSDVRRAHRSSFVGQHPNDGIDDPARTAITGSLAFDCPWLRIASAQPLELLGHVAQPGAVSRSQDLRNFCHKIARSTRMLVRWYLRRLHQMFANRTNTERHPVPAGAGTFRLGRAALAALGQESGAGGQAV